MWAGEQQASKRCQHDVTRHTRRGQIVRGRYDAGGRRSQIRRVSLRDASRQCPLPRMSRTRGITRVP